jgi:hypothetical protein
MLHNLVMSRRKSIMSKRLCVMIVLAGLFNVSPAMAGPPARAQAEYSADATMQTEEGTIRQHVYVTPMKERKETLTGSGEGAVQIFRYDTKIMWTLMPSENMYMEYALKGGQGQGNDPSQWTYEDTSVGEETLNGVEVTKYKTIATSTDGKKYGGFSWRTKEGINLKQDLLYKEGTEKKRMLTELTNLKIGKQDPKLFEIPDGFTKFDMGGMMGMMGGGMGRPGMGQPTSRPDMSEAGMPPPMRQPGTRPEILAPQESPEPQPQAEEPSEIDKAGNFMKGLFGR